MKTFRRIILGILGYQVYLAWLIPLVLMAIYVVDRPRIEDGRLIVYWRKWVTRPRRWLHRIEWPGTAYRQAILGDWVAIARKEDATHRAWISRAYTMGTAIILSRRSRPYILRHEMVHTRQAQDMAVLANCLGVVVGAVEAELWWYLGLSAVWGAYYLPNFLTATLRGGHPSFHSEHERSARAQTDVINGEAWETRELRRRT